LNIQILFC